jgi:hypothetical protein
MTWRQSGDTEAALETRAMSVRRDEGYERWTTMANSDAVLNAVLPKSLLTFPVSSV